MRRLLSSLVGLAVGLPAGAVSAPELHAPLLETIADPDAWLVQRLEEEAARGVWPQAMPRIHRNVDGRADTAILFIHGWGGTRAEGELVVNQIADEWNANVFYMRLPGHGRDAAAQLETKPPAYTRAVAEALNVTAALGDRVVVVGASTGGLLATWAAGEYSEQIDATVLVSPFYDFAAGWVSPVLRNRASYSLVRLAMGRDRYAGWEGMPAEERRDLPGYDDHWLVDQRTAAIKNLDGLRRGLFRLPGFIEEVTAPVLLLHYYKDDDHKDTVVSTDAMLAAYARFNRGTAHPQSRRVPIADGNHVLTSQYVRADHDAVSDAVRSFFTDVIGPAPSGP